MGQQDYSSTLLRLIGTELYKIRRRSMSKVLSVIYALSVIGIFALFSTIVLFSLNTSAASLLPSRCSSAQAVDKTLGPPCLDHAPTQADLAQAQQLKQDQVNRNAEPLRLPSSLNLAGQTARSVGLILVIILAGTIVGGEYGVGTVRLMLTRGPTRLQFLLSKVGALLACIIIGFLAVILLGVVTGGVLNAATVGGQSFGFLTWPWVGHTLLYVLASMFGLFVYAMMALFLGTLGRATVVGVAGALAWSLLEGPIGGGIALLGGVINGPLGNFLKAVPDYLIGNNIGALVDNQTRYALNVPPTPLSDLHALLVLAVYLSIFIGVAWWVNERRDVTN
jgi:ABC-type transport system involved in multi-copper enzyme maturation permease subunit